MYVHATIGRVDFEAALASARNVGADGNLPGMAAPLDSGLWGRISEAWDTVERALRQAVQYGLDAARQGVDDAVSAAEGLVRAAGHRARDVHEALLARLQDYLAHLLDSALSRVRQAVVVGGATLALTGVELSQKISLTGSLKVTITDVAALTGAGEVTVLARYGD